MSNGPSGVKLAEQIVEVLAFLAKEETRFTQKRTGKATTDDGDGGDIDTQSEHSKADNEEEEEEEWEDLRSTRTAAVRWLATAFSKNEYLMSSERFGKGILELFDVDAVPGEESEPDLSLREEADYRGSVLHALVFSSAHTSGDERARFTEALVEKIKTKRAVRLMLFLPDVIRASLASPARKPTTASHAPSAAVVSNTSFSASGSNAASTMMAQMQQQQADAVLSAFERCGG